MTRGQGWVPGAGNVEEVQHLGRIGHAGNGNAGAEDETDEAGKNGTLHQKPPSTWRTTKTVTIAVAMKVAVAAIERGDSRAMPQTPWPEVQPEPK